MTDMEAALRAAARLLDRDPSDLLAELLRKAGAAHRRSGARTYRQRKPSAPTPADPRQVGLFGDEQAPAADAQSERERTP